MNHERAVTLQNFRQEIDALDAQIIDTLARRFKICETIAAFKKKEGIPMMQQSRVEQVKRRCTTLAAQHGLDPYLVGELYGLIIGHSCKLEDKIIGTNHA